MAQGRTAEHNGEDESANLTDLLVIPDQCSIALRTSVLPKFRAKSINRDCRFLCVTAFRDFIRRGQE